MAAKLKKTQPKIPTETPKANVLKKLRGKLKKAFSRKKQVCSCSQPFVYDVSFCTNGTLQALIQEQNEALSHVNEPGTAVLSEISAYDDNHSPTEIRSESAPTPIGVDDEIQYSDSNSQESAEIAPQSLVVSTIGPVVQETLAEPVVQDSVKLEPLTPLRPMKPGRCGLSRSNFSADLNNGKLFSMYLLKRLLTFNTSRS